MSRETATGSNPDLRPHKLLYKSEYCSDPYVIWHNDFIHSMDMIELKKLILGQDPNPDTRSRRVLLNAKCIISKMPIGPHYNLVGWMVKHFNGFRILIMFLLMCDPDQRMQDPGQLQL